MKDILQLNPDTEVNFVKRDIASLPEASIEIKNTSDKTVLYKIKTTDPNKYVVKPNQGILTSGKGTRILITTQKTTMQKIKNDRFLVVASEYDGNVTDIPESLKDLNNYMKNFFDNLPKEKQFMKKLKIVNDETLGKDYSLT
jgi:hypothetical protein